MYKQVLKAIGVRSHFNDYDKWFLSIDGKTVPARINQVYAINSVMKNVHGKNFPTPPEKSVGEYFDTTSETYQFIKKYDDG